LIDNVLDMSKIEADRTILEVTRFDLFRMQRELLDMLGFRADRKGLFFRFERDSRVPRYIETDENKLRQVLVNLIGNAINFTKKGGVVARVREGSDSPDKPDVRFLHFEIEDTGPGVLPDEMDALFKPFVQTRIGRRAREGTGLGLPISRKYVQLMGGDIEVRSEAGKGATFVFDIPVHVADKADVESEAPSRRAVSLEPGQPRYKLLIVDDKPDSRKLLVKLLDPFGFEQREAANGREAVEIWKTWRPHLIWMDIRMPVMDGCEAARRIRREEAGATDTVKETAAERGASESTPRTCKIIALTAGVFEEERADILEAGCDDFLRKPFKAHEIFERMHRHIGVRFIYEEGGAEDKKQTEHGGASRPITPGDFADAPGDILQRLKKAAIDTDMDGVDGILEEIRGIDAGLADGLKELAEDFEYGKIVRLIEEAKAAYPMD
ncbi:MAG: response regulator, partial [Desulfobacterales bacterium]|nr:response regulator [Desulfobacterales bacterium]